MSFRRTGITFTIAVAGLLGLNSCGSMQDILSYKPHESKGVEYLEKGDYARAEEQLKMAVSMAASEKGDKAGNIGRLEYELASMYLKQGKKDDADDAFKRSLIVFSENPKLINDSDRQYWAKCLSDYAVLLKETGRADEAQVRVRQASELMGGSGQPTSQPPAATPAPGGAQTAPPSPVSSPAAGTTGASSTPGTDTQTPSATTVPAGAPRGK